jgi:hypothetical protein
MTRRAKLDRGGMGRGEIKKEKQNNNVHVAKSSDEIDIAYRRHLSLKEISP